MTKQTHARVIISNGYGKFQLIYAALVAQNAGLLDKVLTGAYPTRAIKAIVSPLASVTGNARLKRWLMREAEGLDSDKVAVCGVSEIFYQVGNRFPQFGCN